MTCLRALVCAKVEPNARGLKKKITKEKKITKKREKKSIIGIQMEDCNRIRGVEHGVQRAS